jgi:hypothetical protein
VPDQFTSEASADPGHIKSGEKTTISVGYRAQKKAPLGISCSDGYTVTPVTPPDPVVLAAAPNGGSAKVTVTIERSMEATDDDVDEPCLVTLAAFDDSRDASVEVDP